MVLNTLANANIETTSIAQEIHKNIYGKEDCLREKVAKKQLFTLEFDSISF